MYLFRFGDVDATLKKKLYAYLIIYHRICRCCYLLNREFECVYRKAAQKTGVKAIYSNFSIFIAIVCSSIFEPLVRNISCNKHLTGRIYN